MGLVSYEKNVEALKNRISGERKTLGSDRSTVRPTFPTMTEVTSSNQEAALYQR